MEIYVGIYWQVNGELIYKRQAVKITDSTIEYYNDEDLNSPVQVDKRNEAINVIDYTLSHDDIWAENYEKAYSREYFYYPRGRILYKLNEKHHIIYVDNCTSAKNIENLVRIFNIKDGKYIIDRDSHYLCSVCRNEHKMKYGVGFFDPIIYVSQDKYGNINVTRRDFFGLDESMHFKVGKTEELIKYFDSFGLYDFMDNTVTVRTFAKKGERPIKSKLFCGEKERIRFKGKNAYKNINSLVNGKYNLEEVERSFDDICKICGVNEQDRSKALAIIELTLEQSHIPPTPDK